MSSVEENARSAMDALISELNKERGVSHKYQSMNDQLITQLTNKDTLIHSLQLKITKLESLLSKKTIHDSSVTHDAAVEFADVSDQRETMMTEVDDKKSDDDKDSVVVVDEEEVRKDDSKAVIKLEDEAPPKKSTLKDHSHEFLMEVMKVIRFTFRGYFGESYSNRWGHFVDHIMSAEIHSFADWIEYPTGHQVLKGHSEPVYTAVASTDGYYLFTGDYENCIFVWNMLDNTMMHQWEAHSREVECLDFHSGLLASGSSDGTLRIWDVNHDYRLIHTLEDDCGEVYSVNFNRKGDVIVSGDTSYCVRLWSVKEGTCIKVMKGHSHWVLNTRFINDVIISSSIDNSIRVWNPSNGDQIKCIEDGIGDSVDSFSMNCDASMIALFGPEEAFSVCTWPDIEKLVTVEGKDIWCVCFHPSKPHLIAVADQIGTLVKLYDMKKREYILTLEGHTDIVRKVYFTPDGYRVISVSNDYTVRVWDISDVV